MGSVLVGAFLGLVSHTGMRAVTGRGSDSPAAKAAGDCQVECGWAVQAPERNPNVSRPASLDGSGSAGFATAVVMGPRWQKTWLLDLRRKGSSGGASSKDGSETVVPLGAVAPARADTCMIAEPIRNPIAQGTVVL